MGYAVSSHQGDEFFLVTAVDMAVSIGDSCGHHDQIGSQVYMRYGS